jgi:hypothetical protein
MMAFFYIPKRLTKWSFSYQLSAPSRAALTTMLHSAVSSTTAAAARLPQLGLR